MKNILIALVSFVVFVTASAVSAQEEKPAAAAQSSDEKSVTASPVKNDKPAAAAPAGEEKPEHTSQPSEKKDAAAPPPSNEKAALSPMIQQKKCITDTGDLAITFSDFLAFSSYSGDLYKNYNQDFSFNPTLKMSLEVFLYKGLAIGGVINFLFKDFDSNYYSIWGHKYLTNKNDFTFQLGPSLYYYLNFSNKYIPFIGFNFIFSQNRIKCLDQDDDSTVLSYTINSFNCSPTIGFMYAVNTYFGIFINYSFTARMSFLDEGKTNGSLTDEVLIFMKTNEEERWGYIHTLSIGFKVFFDIR